MVVLGGGAVSYKRGTPVVKTFFSLMGILFVLSIVFTIVTNSMRTGGARPRHKLGQTGPPRSQEPPPPLGPPEGPRHSPTIRSNRGLVSDERGTPVGGARHRHKPGRTLRQLKPRRRGGCPRKVDVRPPGKGNSNSHGARPVYYNHLDDSVDSDH